MDIFMPVFTQMLVLFAFILIGFLLYKFNVVKAEGSVILSKLENTIFVPALVMGTFIENCTVDNIGHLWRVFVVSIMLLFVLLPLSFLSAKLICRGDDFLKKIAIYGLEFSNFGFMGNAIVKAVFPDLFFTYTVFTLPFWFGIYAWGAPTLLIAGSGGEHPKGIKRLKNFVNPMLIAMIIGMIIGLSGLKLPKPFIGAIDTLANCMSPIAMILTGITVAKSNIRSLLKKRYVYYLSFVRLILYPLIFIGICLLLPKNSLFTHTILICGVCMTAMPMGMNPIVIPAAYGKDTSQAAILTIVTHLLSVITIPIMFMLFNHFIK